MMLTPRYHPMTHRPSTRGRNKVQVNLDLSKQVTSYIDARATAIPMKRTQFVRSVITWWLQQGAPAVSEHEFKRGFPEMPKSLILEVNRPTPKEK